MNRILRAGCAFTMTALMLAATAGAAETLEEVEKKLIEAAAKNKSMTAKMVMAMEMDQPNMKMKMKGEGTIETAQRGEKMFNRTEMTTSGTNKFGDQPEQKMEQKILSVIDGEFLYSLSETNGQKMAQKMKIDPSQQKAVTREMFEALRKDHELKLLADEKIEGKDAYVIQATPKKKEDGNDQKSTFWFEKSSAVMVKFVTEGKIGEGKSTTTMTMKDVKLGADIKPERFVFKAPEGVEVVDLTKATSDNTATAQKTDSSTTESTASAQESTEKKPEEKKEPPKEEKKKPLIPKIKLR